jgi:hypothetical protein
VRPLDVVEAEQLGSSPSGENSNVVSSEAGSAFCQYSIPVGEFVVRYPQAIERVECNTVVVVA